jgi:hydrogenase maturation protease
VTSDTLVVAVGNAWRSDDGIGPELGRRLRRLSLRHAHITEAAGDLGLLSLWQADDDVILLDAVVSGATAGTVICRDALAQRMPREWFRLSSHQLGVADAIELARVLGRLPRHLVLVGVEGERFDDGLGLSPSVEAAVPVAVAAVRAELRRLRRQARRPLPARSRAPARQTPARAPA